MAVGANDIRTLTNSRVLQSVRTTKKKWNAKKSSVDCEVGQWESLQSIMTEVKEQSVATFDKTDAILLFIFTSVADHHFFFPLLSIRNFSRSMLIQYVSDVPFFYLSAHSTHRSIKISFQAGVRYATEPMRTHVNGKSTSTSSISPATSDWLNSTAQAAKSSSRPHWRHWKM